MEKEWRIEGDNLQYRIKGTDKWRDTKCIHKKGPCNVLCVALVPKPDGATILCLPPMAMGLRFGHIEIVSTPIVQGPGRVH